MEVNKFNEHEEKIAYDEYMIAEGYIKKDGKWVLEKYPEKDPKSYKGALPSKG